MTNFKSYIFHHTLDQLMTFSKLGIVGELKIVRYDRVSYKYVFLFLKLTK